MSVALYVQYFIEYNGWFICEDIDGVTCRRMKGPYDSEDAARRDMTTGAP